MTHLFPFDGLISSKPEMKELIEKFRDVKLLVVGDLMLDLYLTGTVDRVSPEAPVPILHVEGRRVALGGAANVAANAKSLGADVQVAGTVGSDPEGAELLETLEHAGIGTGAVVRTGTKRTTVKTRLIAQHHQLGRFDTEDRMPISGDDLENLIENTTKALDGCDVAILSDYAKGVVADDLLLRLITKSREIGAPVLVDPKGADFSKYRGATLLTPNEREARAAAEHSKLFLGQIEDVGSALRDHLGFPGLLITRGEKGMALFESGEVPYSLEAHERKVFDVTGAGDTVIASLGVALAAGADMRTAARLANLAAGCVVQRLGTAVVSPEELVKQLGEGGAAHTSAAAVEDPQ